MKSKFLTILLILILVGAFIFLGNIFFSNITSESLINPVGKNLLQTVGIKKSAPTSIPTPTPIQYNFNKSTDLKTELDAISPEVKSSDFDSLKNTTSQL